MKQTPISCMPSLRRRCGVRLANWLMVSNLIYFSHGEETENRIWRGLLSFDNLGYKGREIAEYLRRDPAVITRYLKEGKRLEGEVEKVHEALKKTKKFNKQVWPPSCDRSPRISNVNFPCTTAAFTLLHEPAGFVVLCQLAQGLSLYAVSVRRLARLPSGFLRTPPRGDALAFGSYFW